MVASSISGSAAAADAALAASPAPRYRKSRRDLMSGSVAWGDHFDGATRRSRADREVRPTKLRAADDADFRPRIQFRELRGGNALARLHTLYDLDIFAEAVA